MLYGQLVKERIEEVGSWRLVDGLRESFNLNKLVKIGCIEKRPFEKWLDRSERVIQVGA